VQPGSVEEVRPTAAGVIQMSQHEQHALLQIHFALQACLSLKSRGPRRSITHLVLVHTLIAAHSYTSIVRVAASVECAS
jgi:hypothetical protein